ncbi:hypothetical protein ACFL6C_01040 [Myxococcota bacterium]
MTRWFVALVLISMTVLTWTSPVLGGQTGNDGIDSFREQTTEFTTPEIEYSAWSMGAGVGPRTLLWCSPTWQ